MFNKKSLSERIGEIQKCTSLHHLKDVEKYFLYSVKKHKIEVAYDVIANEIPFFKTLNYTEWAHSFIMHPLQQELRVQQMQDAYNDNAEQKIDFVTYFKNRILSGQSNKYTHIQKDTKNYPRDNLVVLVGSNKLKDRICLNKLKWISTTLDEDVYFKPHPLTTHQLVGELKDLFNDANVLHRDADMYSFLVEAKTVYTSHMSESAVYAICLDKIIEPIDVYNKVEQASFYHINKYLFSVDQPKEWLNRTLNSYKSGIVNPEIEENWKEKIDQYLDYIMTTRAKFKNKYIAKPA
jgi:hypothetical protein